MSIVNFNLRGIPSEIMDLLKQQAKMQDKSVNSFILQLVEQGVGYAPSKTTIYHDLDVLAGTWKANDIQTFKKNTSGFESIDEELWK